SSRMPWATQSRMPRCLTMLRLLELAYSSVLHLAVDVTELEYGECHHDDHQDDGLRRRRAQVQATEAVLVHLVDQDGGGAAGPARCGGVDHRKGIEEGIDDVHDQQEEGRGRQQREHDVPESPGRACTVQRSRF